MFPDYEKAVLKDYQQKKLAGKLRLRLIYPTPAKLKQECIVVLNERDRAKDHKTLQDFFSLQADEKISEQKIRRFDTDKFRPLANFLKNPDINTDPKNIELLAWLIDFQDRPYDYGKAYGSVSLAGPENKNSSDPKETEVAEVTGHEKEKINTFSSDTKLSGKPYFKRKSFVLLASVVVVLIAAVSLVPWLMNGQRTAEQCMYWAGDHYKSVSCNQKMGDTLVIAYDAVRFHRLKKITNPDTITLNDIGKVWYLKKDLQFEYFTYNGYHPVYIRSQLKPITAYIIKKYILPNKELSSINRDE